MDFNAEDVSNLWNTKKNREDSLFLRYRTKNNLRYLLMGVEAKTVEIEPLRQGLMDLIEPA